MGQPVAMFEIVSDDLGRAKSFYADLFDWTLQNDPSMGDYTLVDTGAGGSAVIGGIGSSMHPGDVGGKVYVRVDDLARYLERAEQLGGTKLVEPTALPGDFGSFAIFSDPDGNQVGLWA
jgi:uncharacterized protein